MMLQIFEAVNIDCSGRPHPGWSRRYEDTPGEYGPTLRQPLGLDHATNVDTLLAGLVQPPRIVLAKRANECSSLGAAFRESARSHLTGGT